MVAVFERILEMSAMAAVVIVVVMLIRLLLHKAPRKYSYALWSVAAFRLVCPVSFRAAFSLFNLTKGLDQGSMESILPDPVVSPAPVVSPGYFDSVPPGTGTTVEFDPDNMFTLPIITPPAAEAPAAAPIDWVQIAAIVWLIGLAALLLYGIVSYVRLRRRMSTAVLLEGRVWQSDRVRSPFILGFIRPKIYLPFGLGEEQQRYVLAHERYHLKRLDHIVRPLSFLILAVHWFNPLVWLAYYLMSHDMEMSCDEKVLSGADNIRKAYSTTLLSFAANRRFPSPSPLAFGESGVKGRIKNVLNWKKPRTWVTIIAIILCVVVIIVCASNPLAHPYDWTKSLTVEDVDWAELSFYTEQWNYRRLQDYEVRDLVELLNGLRRREMKQPPPRGSWGFPSERMVTICCNGIEYKLNLGPSPMTLICKDEAVAWGNDDPWFVGSEELKQFIRDLSEADGSSDVQEPVQGAEELAAWHADLTHDGVDEVITLQRNNSEVPYGYAVAVTTSEGTVLWSGNASDWRGGHNGFYLYEQDGKQYLMQWLPAAQQDWYNFSYQVFSLDERGEISVLRENALQYDFGAYENRTDLLTMDLEELRSFEAEINALLKDAIPLLVINNETTILGDPSNPVTDQWTSPAEEWAWYRQLRLEQQADREERTLAVWPLNELTLTVLETKEDGFYSIDVKGESGYFFWEQSIDRRQNGVSYFRYEEDGEQYLMELRDDSSQGVGMWSYRIFSIGPESTPVLRENSLYFQSTNVAEALAVDMADLQAFVNEVNGLLEHVELIAGVSDGRFSYGTPGMDLVYRWDPPLLETVRESQAYWREKERELKAAIAAQCNSYYVKNLRQPDGRGFGQFAVLDQHMDKQGAVVYVTTFFLELDEEGNWLAEYANIPMMFTFDMVDGEYVLTGTWVEEKGKNLDAHDELKQRFPAEAAQAVIDRTYVEQLRQNAHQYKVEQPAYEVSVSAEVKLPGGVYTSEAMLGYAASYIVSAHPDAQDASISSLEEISTGAVGTTSGIPMYKLIYNVKLEGRWHLSKEIYLVLHSDWSSTSVYWYACGAVTQQEIDTIYSTEAMMEQYNNDPYLAATMEVYRQWYENR